MINTHINEEFNTKYGPLKIIDDLGNDGKHRIVIVKFLYTGYICTAQYNHIKDGSIKDPTYIYFKYKDNIFYNSYGQYKIIDYIGYKNKCHFMKILFLNSGAEAIYSIAHILNGTVKDPSISLNEAIKLYGHTKIFNIDYYLRTIWSSMIGRCNDHNHRAYKMYGGRGVKVDDYWLDYNNFKVDAMQIPGWYDKYRMPSIYSLDKDLLQSDINLCERIYSRNTCIWLHNSLNGLLGKDIKYANLYNKYIYNIKDHYYIKNPDSSKISIGPSYSLKESIFILNNYI